MGRRVFEGSSVAVVVPAFREERLIRRTLEAIPEWVDSIIVVDDASDDATSSVVAGMPSSRLHLITLATNAGVGAAIVTGYHEAMALGAELLVVMAGDAQMDPADLPALLLPITQGDADYVKGNRFLHRDARQMPWTRRLAGRCLAALTRAASGLAIDDSQCGYTALSARAAANLPLRDLWPRYGYPNDLLLLLAAGGFAVREVAVRPIYADEISGVRPWHALTVSRVVLSRWRKLRRAKAA